MKEQEFKALVIADYDNKRKKGSLDPRLMVPTRSSLKAHAADICESRYLAKDEPLLRSFFGPRDNQQDYYRAITVAKAELFRTLHNFLTDRRIDPSFLNISMLAWLIDFEPRPYRMDMAPPSPVPPNEVAPPKTQIVPERPVTFSKKTRKGYLAAVIGVLLIGTLTGIYFWKTGRSLTGKERCMIWDDDHYQPIECSESTPGKLHYPIDHRLVKNFKRITRTDTITLASAKLIGFSNVKGRVDFFHGRRALSFGYQLSGEVGFRTHDQKIYLPYR